jgi:outer membrane receptor for ferrienterochelin and colicin
MSLLAKIVFFLFSFLVCQISTIAQNGIFEGTIKNDKGEELPFVNVVSIETLKGGASDLNGNFKFQLPVGKHKVYCSSIGFINDTITVEILENQTVSHNFILIEEDKVMETFSVVRTRNKGSEVSIVNDIKESKQIVNAIGSETIEKTQDSDASEVVKRVPGVTIVGNNFIMIRGLSERYNNVLLHDVFAPSMETDVKSFAFDIIPAGMIDRILVYKSPAPDITGEFAGGIVKIYTKGIPDSNYTSISFSTTYRDGSSFRDFYQPYRSNWHWTGFNDGYNDLPANFPGDVRRVPEGEDGKLNEVGRSLKNNWTPQKVNSNLDKSFSFTHAHKFNIKKIQAGNITSINYSNSRTIFEVERNDYNAYDTVNNRSQFIYKFNDQQFNQNIRTGILSNWAFRFNDVTTIEFKNMFNVFSTTQYVNRTGYDNEFNYSPNNHSFDQIYRGLYSTQLVGTHKFNEGQTNLYWTAGFNYSYRDEPDYRRYRSEIDTNSLEQQLFVGVPLSPNYLGRFFSEMRENAQTVSVRLEHKATKIKFQPILKTGAFVERKYREFNARNIGYVRANFISFNEDLLFTSVDTLFLPENINQSTGIKIGESTNPSDSYFASNFLTAGYVAAEIPFSERLNLNTGVRTEFNVQQLNSKTLTGVPIIVNNPILSILPSANLAYYLKKDTTLIRLAYGKSVNRPEFRELAPFGFYDFSFNLVKKGSDSLRTPTIHNFDLRLEHYPNPGEMITVALFYKKFIDPIETLFVPGGGSGGIKTFTFGNAKEAYSRGIEIEVRKSLRGLIKKSFMDDLSLMLNASFIQSFVNLGVASLGQSNERPLQGQSPYIVNTGLFYQNDKGFQMNVLYNIIGRRIFIIGFDAYPDIYQMPRGVLDFNFSKRLKHNIEFKLNFQDVLNQDVLLIQDANRDGEFNRNNDQVIQRYKPGRTMSIGFGVKF